MVPYTAASHPMTPLPSSTIDGLSGRIASFRTTVSHPLIVVAGPTGTGKTALSIELAKCFSGEVVNADSRQLYRGMEIGAAVATMEERQGIPHHLLSFLDPDEVFTLSDYQKAAFETIDSILAREKLPFLVGGTGLYVNAVSLNYSIPDIPPDPQFREELGKRLEREGFEALRAELATLDPITAGKLQSGQDRYLLRALEIARHGGTKSQLASLDTPRYDSLFILLQADRDQLQDRLAKRVQDQINTGVVGEVRALLDKGYDEHTHALDGISCKEWIPYVRGMSSLEECMAETVRNNQRYAKRQATWFRGLRKKVPADHVITIDI